MVNIFVAASKGNTIRAKDQIYRFYNNAVHVLCDDEFIKNGNQRKSVSEGYVFFCAPAGENGEIRTELYDGIRELPDIRYVIRQPVPEDEVKSYFESIPTDCIEWTMPSADLSQTPQQERDLLHNANMADDDQEKKWLFDQLEEDDDWCDQLQDVKAQSGKQGISDHAERMIAACYVLICNEKTKFVFPQSLVQKTLRKLKKESIHAVDALYVIPAILRVMRDEVQTE